MRTLQATGTLLIFVGVGVVIGTSIFYLQQRQNFVTPVTDSAVIVTTATPEPTSTTMTSGNILLQQ